MGMSLITSAMLNSRASDIEFIQEDQAKSFFADFYSILDGAGILYNIPSSSDIDKIRPYFILRDKERSEISIQTRNAAWGEVYFRVNHQTGEKKLVETKNTEEIGVFDPTKRYNWIEEANPIGRVAKITPRTALEIPDALREYYNIEGDFEMDEILMSIAIPLIKNNPKEHILFYIEKIVFFYSIYGFSLILLLLVVVTILYFQGQNKSIYATYIVFILLILSNLFFVSLFQVPLTRYMMYSNVLALFLLIHIFTLLNSYLNNRKKEK